MESSSSFGFHGILLPGDGFLCSALFSSGPRPKPRLGSTVLLRRWSVRRPSLSKMGSCEVFVDGSTRGIMVEETGVKSRLEFLDCCLVFRFVSTARVDWPAFRRWAAASWGTPLDSPVLRLADELWMLVCSSKAEVLQIVALRRWSFGNIAIQFDPWIAEAGLSGVAKEKGVGWVLARGIPVHLRSPNLFSRLGEECGEFLDFEDEGDLNSVRLKVKLAAEVPREVVLFFGEERFAVRLQAEVADEAEAAVIEVSSGGGEEGSVCFEVDELAQPEALSCSFQSMSRVAEEVESLLCRGGAFVGLRLEGNEISIVAPPFRSELLVRLEGQLVAAGVFAKGGNLDVCGARGVDGGLLRFKLAVGPWAFSSGLRWDVEREFSCLLGLPFKEAQTPFPVFLRGLEASPLSLLREKEVRGEFSEATLSGGEIGIAVDSESVLGEGDDQESFSEITSLDSEIEEVAKLIGLSVNGSVEAGVAAAVAFGKKVRGKGSSSGS
ncbi:hypothetical protein LINPERPRIM_LOCUS17055 [Linum perenne]